MDMLRLAEARRKEESIKLNDAITKLEKAEARRKEESVKLNDAITKLEKAEARIRKEGSVKLNDVITKLEKADARIRKLENKLPAVVTAALVAALRNPEALQQPVDPIGEPQVTVRSRTFF